MSYATNGLEMNHTSNGANGVNGTAGRAKKSKKTTESDNQLAAMQQKLINKPKRVTGVRLFAQQVRARRAPRAHAPHATDSVCAAYHRAQLEALMYKNATLTWRNKPAAILQFLATFVFILLIYGVAQAIELQNRNESRYQDVLTPPVNAVTSIPDCSKSVRLMLYMWRFSGASALLTHAPPMRHPCATHAPARSYS